MKNQFNLEDYNLLQDKKNNNWLFMVIIFLTTIGIFIILFKFDFSTYEKHTLIKNNSDFIITVNSLQINEIEKSKYIYINHKKYEFEIIKISQDYTTVNDNIYQSVYINPHNYKTDAIITECYFLKSKKTIYELIIEFITGGIG